MNFTPDTLVKSCPKLESGLRLGREGILACQLGPFSAPPFWTGEEAQQIKTFTKEMIVEKRRELFLKLNDENCDITCKHCQMLVTKRYADVDFTKLGHIDLAACTICNLRCSFCAYTMFNLFAPAKYDALAILRLFSPEDVEWDAAVDFNGGEPTLLPDFDDYIDYFLSRRIRVFLYTNAVKFSQSVYDGLANGNIRWVCSSLDCGTPSSFRNNKQRDHFLQVMENITRYAHAGNQGGGNLAIKYIFCHDNCGEDDVAGFVYAMLAIRPQKIWLTFDFEPLKGLPGDSDDFCGRDFSKHVSAYAKVYWLLERHGVECEHFAKRHLAVVSRHGKILLDRAIEEIERLRREEPPVPPELNLQDFRRGELAAPPPPAIFSTAPLRLRLPGEEPKPWSLKGKRVAVAPACIASIKLLSEPELKEAEVVAFIDRDQVLHGKRIEGIPVYSYGEMKSLNLDVILSSAPEIHRADILRTIEKHADKSIFVATAG